MKQAQEVIMKDQDQSIGQQKESNVLLGKVIATIEQTNDIMGESQENKHILNNQLITNYPGAPDWEQGELGTRVAYLCDDLAGAVTGLMSCADNTATDRSSRLEEVDDIIKTCRKLINRSQDQGKPTKDQGTPTNLLAYLNLYFIKVGRN